VAFQAEVACRVEVVLVWLSSVSVGQENLQLFLCVSHMYAQSVESHYGKQGIGVFDFDEAATGVNLSQCSPVYVKDNQYPAASLL